MRLSDNHLSAALTAYGYGFSRLDFTASGYRNTSHIVETTGGKLCNLIVYKREPGIAERIQRINHLSSHVRATGLPVRTPLDMRILRLDSASGESFASLYSFEHGGTIPWEAYTKKHIKLLGMAMGRFHAGARNYEGPLPRVTDEYRDIVKRMDRYFSDAGTKQAIQQKLSVNLPHSPLQLLTILDDIDTLSGAQPLHMDLVRGNVLFREAETRDVLVIDTLALSGILDLEKAGVGHPVLDAARTLAFLLVDCSKTADKIYRYFLHSGYVKRGGGRLEGWPESVVLERLVSLFLLYDFYKFLRQNPYESLPHNHHFVRTRDTLVARKVIQLG